MKLKDAFSNLLMAYDKVDRRTLKDAFMIGSGRVQRARLRMNVIIHLQQRKRMQLRN